MRDKRLAFHIAFHKRKALKNDPKVRRMQLMLTRYLKPKCIECGELAYYKLVKRAWCKGHLPSKLRKKLSLEYQYSRLINYAEFIDGGN